MPRVSDLDRFIFIVGAPRCGTTTLSHFLKDHPAVRFPIVKEPHFFAQNDLRDLTDKELREVVENKYLARFFQTGSGRRIAADASVTYLYTPEQLEPIMRLWPDSRFVIALRDPLTMLPSLHQRLLFLGIETIGTFERAWTAARASIDSRSTSRPLVDPRWLRYDEAARFATYLERLFAVVGRDRCLVVILDDLASNPEEQYRRLMSFAGLAPVPDTEFVVRRPSRVVRVPWLQTFLKRPVIRMRKSLADEASSDLGADARSLRVERMPGFVLSLRKRLLRWNRRTGPNRPLPPAMQREIQRHFEGEIARLSGLLGRDFSHWLDARSRPKPVGGIIADAETRTLAEITALRLGVARTS